MKNFFINLKFNLYKFGEFILQGSLVQVLLHETKTDCLYMQLLTLVYQLWSMFFKQKINESAVGIKFPCFFVFCFF